MENLKFANIVQLPVRNGDLEVFQKSTKVVPTNINSELVYISGNREDISIKGSTLDFPHGGLTYFDRIGTLCAALIASDSQIYLADLESCELQCFSCLFDKILLCSLSPFDDYLLVIDNEFNVYLLSTQDFVAEKCISLFNDSAIQKPLNVGWGSDKTQFKGVAKNKQNVTPAEISSQDLYSSWAPNGDHVAISYWQDDRRKIKIFTKDLQPLCLCEHIGGLAGPLVWRYDSNFLFAVQSVNDNKTIVMFEKNGLKFSEFSLRTQYEVRDIICHPEMPFLLVTYYIADEDTTQLHFWTVKNSHWYLKKSMHLEQLLFVAWDTNQPLALNVVTKKGHFLYTFQYIIDSSFSSDLCTVAFIDGKKLNVTNFTNEVIPPPFSKFNCEFEVEIYDIQFSEFDQQLLVYLRNGKLMGFKALSDKFDTVFEYFNTDVKPTEVIRWGFLDAHRIFRFDCNRMISTFKISAGQLIKVSEFLAEDKNVTIVFPKKHGNETDIEELVLLPINNYKKVRIYNLDGKNHVFVLYQSGKLFVNDKIFDYDIKSFALTTSFLLLISLQHKLKCVWLQELFNNDENSTNFKKVCDFDSFYQRSLEMGSDFVTVCPNSSKVILQMPRGNVETIHPRLLLIHQITQLIKSEQFVAAYELMERHRINLNLFYDICDDFVSKIAAFVAAINNHYLKLKVVNNKLIMFLAQIEDKNVLNALYGTWFKNPNNNVSYDSKCAKISEKFVNVITRDYNTADFLPTLIIANVIRKTDEFLVSALRIIWNLRETDSSSLWEPQYLLKLILNMVDIDILYRSCLKVGQLDIALYVVSNSNADPKLYVPFIRELKELDEDSRIDRINNFLK